MQLFFRWYNVKKLKQNIELEYHVSEYVMHIFGFEEKVSASLLVSTYYCGP